MMTYYLHTINGKPAMFDGDQICFMSFYGRADSVALSLKQIRLEQRASKEYREAFGAYDSGECHYVRVSIPGDRDYE